MDDSDVPAKAYFMAAATGGCIISHSLLLKRGGMRSQYCSQKFAALRRKWPQIHCTPDFKQEEPAMTQLLRRAVFDQKLWSGVAMDQVRKNVVCLVKDKSGRHLAELKRAGGLCQTKAEFVQFLTSTCIDYSRSFGVSAAA